MHLYNKIVSEYIGDGPLLMHDETLESICLLETPAVIINEGLIKTYPIQKSIEAFGKVFHLYVGEDGKSCRMILKKIIDGTEDYNGTIRILPGSEEESKRIEMILGNGDYNKDVANRYMSKYGYVLASEFVYTAGWKRFIYDKKFDEDATSAVRLSGTLYHLCRASVVDKILKQGLTPRKSEWDNFKNDERCYFFINLTQEELHKWAYNFKVTKHTYEPYALLKIDVKNLSEDIRFYLDPRIKNGIYTLEGISPKNIEVVSRDI